MSTTSTKYVSLNLTNLVASLYLENGIEVGNAGARELDEGKDPQDPGYGEQDHHEQHSHGYCAAAKFLL